MGYRSEVAIAMRKEDYELLKEFDKENKNLIELLEMADKKEYNGAISLKWEWLKWYPEFSEVQAIEEFLCKLSDEDKPYKFIRIGEEYDDIETENNWGDEEKYGEVVSTIYDMIGIIRYIDTYID
jgi:hypothetical protein